MTPEQYMHRCIELAQLGAGKVAPNPMVGAVLVYKDKILGEGYHQKYGEAHAEVNCIASVRQADQPLIAKSTMHVSLEPCVHFGKTPPCTDLIISRSIRKAIVGCRDPFKQVDGKALKNYNMRS
jgi:diaminohydroxyphosphoribosylaminopyrimidine deaminase/5-amino-6-(5-phosphoribosylamino)uracil reductase